MSPPATERVKHFEDLKELITTIRMYSKDLGVKNPVITLGVEWSWILSPQCCADLEFLKRATKAERFEMVGRADDMVS